MFQADLYYYSSMIGLYDSGFGGLTVMKEYLKKFPEYDYMYLGDQANMPYGAHSSERLKTLAEKSVKFLIDRGCKLIIFACNSASSDALRHIQSIYNGKPTILGVLVPAVEEAIKKSPNGRIGVMGTRATINSGAYEKELKKYSNGCVSITQNAAPLLVPLVEEGMLKSPETRALIKKYVRPFKSANVDTLILGCTHYPLLQKEIERIMGKRCTIISSSKAAVSKMREYFRSHPEVEKQISRNGNRTYLTTDSPGRFEELGGRFLGLHITSKKVSI